MADRTPRVFVLGLLAMIMCATAGLSTATAQQNQPPNVSAFFANPGQLLQQYPSGGRPLTVAVQQLALTDPTTFKLLLGLVANANELQKGAIGEGLAQAAKIEVLTNQPLATDWQQQIGAIADPAFKLAATRAFGDVQLGAVGGGPLGAAGGGGGQTNPFTQGTAQNGSPVPIPTTVRTQSFTFSSGVTGATVANTPTVPPNGPTNPVSR